MGWEVLCPEWSCTWEHWYCEQRRPAWGMLSRKHNSPKPICQTYGCKADWRRAQDSCSMVSRLQYGLGHKNRPALELCQGLQPVIIKGSGLKGCLADIASLLTLIISFLLRKMFCVYIEQIHLASVKFSNWPWDPCEGCCDHADIAVPMQSEQTTPPLLLLKANVPHKFSSASRDLRLRSNPWLCAAHLRHLGMTLYKKQY